MTGNLENKRTSFADSSTPDRSDEHPENRSILESFDKAAAANKTEQKKGKGRGTRFSTKRGRVQW